MGPNIYTIKATIEPKVREIPRWPIGSRPAEVYAVFTTTAPVPKKTKAKVPVNSDNAF
jgi:hypothetical protein